MVIATSLMEKCFYTVLCIVAAIILLGIIYAVLKSPFHYPYYMHSFNVSGKRNPKMEDLIDKYLIEDYETVKQCYERILQWKKECQNKIDCSRLKKLREKQFAKSLDDDAAFTFKMYREQTRYKQVNYKKTAYKVEQEIEFFQCGFDWLAKRNKQLKKINYECTLNDYHSKDQRKIMTRELRLQIMSRDNYTCQCCGKYMPDEVGLHIDHIIPISKGGKSVSTNLQVLCSKCNGKKSNRLEN